MKKSDYLVTKEMRVYYTFVCRLSDECQSERVCQKKSFPQDTNDAETFHTLIVCSGTLLVKSDSILSYSGNKKLTF